MRKKVLVAMSGGVDSSVSAYLLKEEGFEVVGITMHLGFKICHKDPRCYGQNPTEDGKIVCERLNIPHYVMDFSHYLEEKVISKFIDEYLKGRTPNPCIDCNRFLKFGILLEKAISWGFDFFATGHYAKIENFEGRYILSKARDKKNDQSYFLYPIKKENLNRILSPLGDFSKEEVRKLAKRINLPVAEKPKSQDICFIQDDYRKFILNRVGKIKEGEIVDLKGNILGKHKGIFFYTVGQRERLGITFCKPLYVISILPEKNQIIVGEKKDLYAKGLVATNFNFFVDDLPEKAFAKIRYPHKETKCGIYPEGERIKIIFEEKQMAITCGQSVVLYKNDTVLGGGVIEEVIW